VNQRHGSAGPSPFLLNRRAGAGKAAQGEDKGEEEDKGEGEKRRRRRAFACATCRTPRAWTGEVGKKAVLAMHPLTVPLQLQEAL
jgi:hypothetical protein